MKSDVQQRARDERFLLQTLTETGVDTVVVSAAHLRRLSDLIADLAWPEPGE